MNPIFSIVSVNFNGGEKIIDSIKSVFKQIDISFEIIVIDNGSVDGSYEKILAMASDKLKVIRLEKNFGFTVGANTGANNAKGKYLLILNNDAYLDGKDFLAKAALTLDNSDESVCGLFPKVVFNWEPSVLNSTFVVWHDRQMWYDPENGFLDQKKLNPSHKEETRTVFGAMFVAPIFKTKLWLKVSGFDERFFTYAEDLDLSYRMNLLGYKYLYYPDIKVLHDFRSSSKDDSNPLWSYYYFQRNYLFVAIKNYELKNIFRKFPIYTVYFRSALISAIKNHDKPMLQLLFRVISSLIGNMAYLLKKRSEIQGLRKKNDSEIWDYGFALNFNPYYYNNKIVLNLNSIETKND